ncbi:methyl-accepting chemotaxis protein [Shewanella sp. WXL01]|uniref:HAMP domain-containing protein n=1 Tax=Shewanella maritima TaxID=2520507 RepID=A0A411PDV2_9GAMM|nr:MULTISPECIES: methyl-accepting chemotaxis protein [Shewanella]NKF50310.1 methyl-accepting chemotaxis protein [Shewanella sp. WXL01]QBF81668.1 HAMP domain-containing protein [Shewanella maritima]
MGLQWIGNIKMSNKLALMILPPLLAFVFYGGTFVVNKYQSQSQLSTVLELSELAVVNGALVHELQKERGMSAGFIGSKGQSFAASLPKQRQLTDEQVRRYQQFIASHELPSEFGNKLSNVDASLGRLASVRQQVDNLTISLAEEVAYYTGMNGVLLSLVDDAASQSQISELSIKIKAFGAFLQLKERAGIERAVLSSTFGNAGFKPGAYKKFVTLVSEQNTYAERFNAAATSTTANEFAIRMSGDAEQAVQRFRDIAFSQDVAQIQSQNPEQWFDTSTRRIGVLTEFEKVLATDLIDITKSELSSAQTHMYIATFNLVLLTAFVLFMSVNISNYIHRNLKHMQKQVTSAGENADMAVRLDIQSQDEFGQVAKAFNVMMDDFEGIVAQVKSTTGALVSVVEQINQFTYSLRQDVDAGYSEVEQVASAMTEMTATVNEIAQHAESTSEASAKANKEAQTGNSDVSKTSQAISQLANEINEAGESIQQLDNDIQGIVAILDVISSIAEQTNLLALNAAIEAARAGEQGRGFAVVADEVRTLAQRAQNSTDDIKNMTERLKSGAAIAVKAMERGRTQAEASVAEAEHAGEELSIIVSLVSEIDSMNEQVAAATHEQTAVSEEVNRNAMKISELYVNTQEIASKIAELNAGLLDDASVLNAQVSKFHVSES